MNTNKTHKSFFIIYPASGMLINRWYGFGFVALIVVVELLKWLLH
jgi:hypothetical protein